MPRGLLMGQRSANELTRQGAGMLVIAQQHFTIDDGRRYTRSLLFQAPGASRQVVNQFRHHRPNAIGVKDHDIRRLALA